MVVAALSLGATAAAQTTTADSLLAAGRIADAETWYYGASDARPRDPVARAALGRYLASRGALRVGAVLLEEARQFGGDPVRIARDLAPIYRALGDYRDLTTLPASPLSAAERAQAVWLVSHAPSVAGPESVSVSIKAPRERGAIGNLTLRVEDVPLDAVIDAHRHGVTIDTSWRRRSAAVFGGGRTGAPLGVIASVTIGDLSLGNVPVAFAPLGAKRAVIGLDVLARFAPTVDVAAGRVILRSSGEVTPRPSGTRLPTLAGPDDLKVLLGGHFVSLGTDIAADSLRHRRWTLDATRGELVIAP